MVPIARWEGLGIEFWITHRLTGTVSPTELVGPTGQNSHGAESSKNIEQNEL